MATTAQIKANRLNALKSTGPCTPRGKTIASQNSLKHGLSAHQPIIAGESQPDYDLYTDQMLAELNPLTPIESMLAHRVISLSWRLKRAVRFQNQAIDAMLQRNSFNPLAKLTQSLPFKFPGLANPGKPPSDDLLALGRAAINDLSNARVLERLLMYERRIEHSLYKTILEIQRLHLMRQLDPLSQADEETAYTALLAKQL